MSWTDFFKRNSSILNSYDEIKFKIEEFIEKGANINEDVLHLASRKGYSKVVKVLIENGANANVTDELNRTPLHYATAGAHL